MTIRHLRTFVIVFQKESITKASEILHVSQPSVSLAIQELENYYHIRLFDRIGKRLSITEQGKWLYDYALHIVSMFDTKTIEQYILNNEVDLALIEGKTEYEQIQMEHLMEDPLCLICAANSELVKQEKISLIDLERYPMILRERGSAVREMIEESLGYHQIHHRVIWESVSTQAIIRAVAKKLGISILPYLLVRDELARGLVKQLQVEEFHLSRQFSIAYHKKKYLTPAAKGFMELCKEKIPMVFCEEERV